MSGIIKKQHLGISLRATTDCTAINSSCVHSPLILLAIVRVREREEKKKPPSK